MIGSLPRHRTPHGHPPLALYWIAAQPRAPPDWLPAFPKVTRDWLPTGSLNTSQYFPIGSCWTTGRPRASPDWLPACPKGTHDWLPTGSPNTPTIHPDWLPTGSQPSLGQLLIGSQPVPQQHMIGSLLDRQTPYNPSRLAPYRILARPRAAPDWLPTGSRPRPAHLPLDGHGTRPSNPTSLPIGSRPDPASIQQRCRLGGGGSPEPRAAPDWPITTSRSALSAPLPIGSALDPH